jgi:hypothetical protein
MASIRITLEYHALRIYELELTADYLAKKQAEKVAEREDRASAASLSTAACGTP